jgi:hypothetical protein
MPWCGTRYSDNLAGMIGQSQIARTSYLKRYNLTIIQPRRASGLLEPSREPERPAARLQMESLGRSPGYDRRYVSKERLK